MLCFFSLTSYLFYCIFPKFLFSIFPGSHQFSPHSLPFPLGTFQLFGGFYCHSGEGNGTPLQYTCLENPMGGGAWWAAVHGVAKSRTRLSNFTFTFHFHALEKEMETHSSVLAWRVPGTGEPGGLLCMGSHRVGHDLSDLAAAATATASQMPGTHTSVSFIQTSLLSSAPKSQLPNGCLFLDITQGDSITLRHANQMKKSVSLFCTDLVNGAVGCPSRKSGNHPKHFLPSCLISPW